MELKNQQIPSAALEFPTRIGFSYFSWVYQSLGASHHHPL